MVSNSKVNKAQSDYWSSAPGLKWIEHESALDQAMSGMLSQMLDVSGINSGHRVLDIGCGTGASTFAAAELVGTNGSVTGLDISEPLLERAKARASELGQNNIDFLLADAQSYDFKAAKYDLVISRLRMMFFEDPVEAFGNIASALKPGGKTVFIAWAPAAQNPWFHIPKAAAVARLGPPPPSDPTAPGPLAFQDVGYVVGLMKSAGLVGVVGDTIPTLLTPPGDHVAAARAASRVGPAARIMKAHNGTDEDAQAIETAVAQAFMDFASESGVQVTGAVNLFSAARAAA